MWRLLSLTVLDSSAFFLRPSVASPDRSCSCFQQTRLILIKSFHMISSLSAGKVLETVSLKFNTYINKKYKVFRVSIR